MNRTKEECLSALSAFINQRPGLEFGNYGDVSAYRQEMRAITKRRHDCDELMAAIGWRSITVNDIVRAASYAFLGRLSYDVFTGQWNYCTGQYFPTEYRNAAARVLAQALWDYWRNDTAIPLDGSGSMRDHILKQAKKNLSVRVYREYFKNA